MAKKQHNGVIRTPPKGMPMKKMPMSDSMPMKKMPTKMPMH